MSNEQVSGLTPEQAKEQAEIAAHFRQVRKHLKTRGKNELIQTVLQLMGALMESQRINKFLNEQLKDQTKENSNAQSSSTSPDPA